MTTATLFRAIQAARPTLLIDEADTFIGDADNMRGIINAGHCRATATVLRNVPSRDGWEVRQFDVWGALALAAIGTLPGTIEDRSIKIAMRRRRSDEPIKALRIDRLESFGPLARRAARWAADHYITLSAADPKVPTELHDRAADNWRPLLAIADVAGGEWPHRARLAAILLTRDGTEADDTEASGVLLLADLRELFCADGRGVLFTTEILSLLCEREDRPWTDYNSGRPIRPTQVARLLKPFGIPTNRTQRRGSETGKGYRKADLADPWKRYLPEPEPVTRSHASDSPAVDNPRSVTPADSGGITPSNRVTESVTDES